VPKVAGMKINFSLTSSELLILKLYLPHAISVLIKNRRKKTRFIIVALSSLVNLSDDCLHMYFCTRWDIRKKKH